MRRTLFLALMAASAWAAPAAAAEKSLFAQVISLPAGADAWQTRTWFEKVCSAHKQPGSPDYIHNLVLSEIAATNGTLDDERLAIVEDYFGCFDNVFVGTVNLPHADPYVSGMKNETFRWDNILISEQVAKAWEARFLQRFPGQTYHWYVSYEANLNYLATDAALRDAYAAFLLELSNRLTQVRAGSVLWSPAFWTKYASVSNKSALSTAVASVLGTAPKVNWLHFQDFVGQAATRDCGSGAVSYGFSASDGIGYHGLLTQAVGGQLASLRVNLEHFVLGGSGCPAGSIYPGEASEIAARESAYAAAGVPIGASWEIRWWYRALYGTEPATCNQTETCNGADDDCDLLVDEDGVCGSGGTSGSGGASGNGSGGASGSAGAPGGSGGGWNSGGESGAPGGGAGGTATPAGGQDEPGCGCRVSSERQPIPVLFVLALLLVRRRWAGRSSPQVPTAFDV